jgi:murein DD-endopeptidase MepM/ murein hydrolase activator NlpD
MRYVLPILFSLFLASATMYVKERRTPQEPFSAHTLPGTREAWSIALLEALRSPQPTPAMVAEVVAWTLAEDSGGGAMDRNNPWNTTMCGFNQVSAINNDGACGVAGYATFEDGIAATVATLEQDNFAGVRSALLNNDVEGFKSALWSSPWAASHYGYGAHWPQETRACPLDPCWQSGTGYSAEHPGIDLGAAQGQPVYATMGGVVRLSDTWPCGLGVEVREGDVSTLACHLSGFAVADGAAVSAGDVVGYAGSTGLSTGVHVHFEIRVGGVNVDPGGSIR